MGCGQSSSTATPPPRTTADSNAGAWDKRQHTAVSSSQGTSTGPPDGESCSSPASSERLLVEASAESDAPHDCEVVTKDGVANQGASCRKFFSGASRRAGNIEPVKARLDSEGMRLFLDSNGKIRLESGTLVDPENVEELHIQSTSQRSPTRGEQQLLAGIGKRFTTLRTLRLDAFGFDDSLLDDLGQTILEDSPRLEVVTLRRYPKYKKHHVIISPVVRSLTCEYGYFQSLRLPCAKSFTIVYAHKLALPASSDDVVRSMPNLESFKLVCRTGNSGGGVISILESLANAQVELQHKKGLPLNRLMLRSLTVDSHPEELIGFPAVLDAVEVLDAPVPDMSDDTSQYSVDRVDSGMK